MRPRNPRFVSVCDQFSFFITHHIPSPLSCGFEYPLHHRLCRNWLLPITVCGSALLCLEYARTPVPPSPGWLLFILPDWGHHFLWKSFLHSRVYGPCRAIFLQADWWWYQGAAWHYKWEPPKLQFEVSPVGWTPRLGPLPNWDSRLLLTRDFPALLKSGGCLA